MTPTELEPGQAQPRGHRATPTILVPVAVTSFDCCARCGESHDRLNVWRFGRPVVDHGEVIATHWTLCLKTGEPILVRFEYPPAFERETGK